MDETTLIARFELHRSELRLHAYRMLGSSHDADDVLQEASVRAWRSRDAQSEASSTRAWLYRIVTNVCLDEIAKRRAREAMTEVEIEAALEPIPDVWLAGVDRDPAASIEAKESVQLAFVAALQFLTPPQRATLLLRDVVGLTAEETARDLAMTREAANSALHRAREAMEGRLGERRSSRAPFDEALLARYLRAWNESDFDAFVALLHDEIRTTMPPAPRTVVGLAANVDFFRPMFGPNGPRFLVRRVAANAQPAFAAYRASSPSDPFVLRAISLIGIRDAAIVAIDHIMTPEVFPLFGLPLELPFEREK